MLAAMDWEACLFCGIFEVPSFAEGLPEKSSKWYELELLKLHFTIEVLYVYSTIVEVGGTRSSHNDDNGLCLQIFGSKFSRESTKFRGSR